MLGKQVVRLNQHFVMVKFGEIINQINTAEEGPSWVVEWEDGTYQHVREIKNIREDGGVKQGAGVYHN